MSSPKVNLKKIMNTGEIAKDGGKQAQRSHFVLLRAKNTPILKSYPGVIPSRKGHQPKPVFFIQKTVFLGNISIFSRVNRKVSVYFLVGIQN